MTTRSRYTAAITDKPWWLAGGIPANACIAAYQPKGASDYTASKVNLANPGTYNAIDGAVAPAWDGINGWQGDGASKYLNTGIVAKHSHSVIVRVANLNDGATYGYTLGVYKPGYGIYQLGQTQANIYNFRWGSSSYYQPVYTAKSGTFAISNSGTESYYYVNGEYKASSAIIQSLSTVPIYILARNYGSDLPSTYSTAHIYALSIYDHFMTDYQVAELTRAINAL